MNVNMSFTINATTAQEISRGIRELAAILDASAKDAGINPEPAKVEVAPAPEAPQNPATPAVPATQTVSMEDVRSKLAGLVQSGKQAEVKELLASFGATKLSDVPEERYAELLEKAGAIG